MRAASVPLADFLATKPRNAIYPELYTITLLGGSVLRWTDADITVSVPGGFTYPTGPRISDLGVKSTRGFNTDDFQMEIADDGTTIVAGVPLLQLIANNGLQGAAIQALQGYGPGWGQALTGTSILFVGRFAELRDLGDSKCTVIWNCWFDLLNQQSVNQEVISSQCRHALFDPGCGISAGSYTASCHVNSGSATTTSFPSNCALAAGVCALGTITFTSGANNGQTRTVRSQDGSGNIGLILALPAVPASGDTFTITQGCDLVTGTCSGRFNNLIHFGGFEFVPSPELGY